MKAKSEPIPIGKGLRIAIGESGEPLSIGAALHEAAERASDWIEKNPHHPRIEEVRRWVESVEQIDRQRAIEAKAEKIAKPALDYADAHFKGKKMAHLKDAIKHVVIQHAREQAEKGR